ncbi:MAG: hypothetical protein ACPG7F_02030 [Aggregatilineales bacterium]
MFRLIDTLFFTLERIRNHLVLVFWVLVGISVATTLSLSLPLYVDSVYSGILASRLDDPPYAFRFRYLGVWNGNINPADVDAATAAIQGRFAESVDLPTYHSVRYIRGGNWSARLAREGAAPVNLGTFGIGTLEGAMQQIDIIDGEWASDSDNEPLPDGSANNPIPMLVPEEMLYGVGLQVGDTVQAVRPGGQPLTFEVSAIWRPLNENDPAWIFTPKFFDNILLVEPEILWQLLDGQDSAVDEVAWYLNFDGRMLLTSEIDALLETIVVSERDVGDVLPGIRFDLSPQDGLRAFSDEVSQLTQQLFIIIMPVGGLVLYFVSLVAGLLVTRQQNEDVKLRSRGMSRIGIMTIHTLMWLLIVGTALLIGILLSPYIVRLIGRTASFLNFEGVSSVTEVVLTSEALAIGAATGFIAASSGLLLAWRITLKNINSLRRTSTTSGKAWWQRMYLDVMTVIPAFYVLYTLQQQNGITAGADTPFADPLTFLGPTMFALGLTLLFLRVLPMVLGVLGNLVAITNNVSLMMALRELTRNSGRYRGALLMMAFTLSLTGFTASMASTLDRSLVDSINYRVGAEMVLVTAPDAQTEAEQDADSGQQTLTVVGYNAPPIQELEGVEGIEHLTRVGRYDARLSLRGQRLNGQILGIDRHTLAAVTRFREDFSTVELSEMMNQLATQRTGVVISQATLEEYGLLIGQEIEFEVNALGEWQNAMRAPIVGVVEYFPTLDPRELDFFLITNITPIFEMSGSTLPFNVWLTLENDANPDDVIAGIQDVGFPVIRALLPAEELAAAQAEPARRGVLGFLSIGFVASIALTLIGTVIQSTASFRAQAAQLGSLRAMGLGSFTVAIYMILLQGMAAASGILSGTSIGVATTLLFLPLLDFSGGLPPYLVRVAWGEIAIVYAIFAGVLFFVTLFTSIFLSRQQLSTVVKLGES